MGVINKFPLYLEKIPGGGLVTTSLDAVFNWGRACSLWYLLFGTACCAIEGLMCTGASRYDYDRFGMFYRASPRQADLMIVAGTVTYKMAKRIKILYEQMSEPKYVIAMGGCTIRGGPFYYDCYSVLRGIDLVIPVDVYVPGCPPRPESILEGCLKLQAKVKRQKVGEWSKDEKLLLQSPESSQKGKVA